MSVKSSCSPDDNSEELSRRLLEMCDDAMRQICIPANDREFYEVCFLVPVRESLSSLSTLNGREYSNNNNNNNNNSERSLRCELERRYSSLMSLYRHLDRHRAATVRVLQLCQHRDELVKEMLRICEDYQAEATGQRSPPAPPALFARAMEEHHIVTLFLLEAIFDWREQLSRPFPFVVAQENYLYRILDDCRLIDASLLGNVMRLRLTEYPLGSYRSSGSGTGGGAFRLGRKKTPFICDSGNGNNNSSSINTSTGGGSLVEGDKTSVTVHMHGGGCSPVGRSMTLDRMRLKWGESVIKTEHVLQRRLACELTSMLSQGLFVTVLATPDIVRGAADGLPLVIDNKHTVWRGRVVTEAAELTATGRDDATAEEEEADVLPQQSDASLEIITHTNESSM